jgi:hypothetical protein
MRVTVSPPPAAAQSPSPTRAASPATPRSGPRRDGLQPPPSPLHLRRSPFVKSGYRIFASAEAALDTFLELNNETFNVYASLAGVAMATALAANLSFALNSHADIKYNASGLLAGLALYAAASVLFALHHLYLPVVRAYAFWNAMEGLAETASFLAWGLTLATHGLGLHELTNLARPGLLDAQHPWLYWYALLVVMAYVGAFVADQREAASEDEDAPDAPALFRALNLLLGFGVLLPLFAVHRAGSTRALLAVSALTASHAVQALQLPERFVSRAFDFVGNSRFLGRALHLAAFYFFFTDVWKMAIGHTELLWEQLLLC